MSYLALYREWRPKTFDEVVEQKQAVYALRQAVKNRQIAHAYLFSGTRGTGKTTLAKIFSRAINCLDPQDGNPCNQCQICKGILDGSLMDVVEMDAASNNSVDNIRRICDEVVFMPSLAKYKVYIIDEVHMLSTGAFNALLKTLEEPPAHAVFILATTEPHRLPATILSRCQRYDFRRIPQDGIAARLKEIAVADGIDLTEEALEAISSFADGAMRDAISLLDQARASIPGKIERNDVLALAGITQDDFMLNMGTSVINGRISDLLAGIDELVMGGRDLARFISDLAQFFRNLLICQVSATPEKLIQATDQTIAEMKQLSAQTGYKLLIKLIEELSEIGAELRWSSDARTSLEVGLIRIIAKNSQISLDKTYLPQPQAQPVQIPAQPQVQAVQIPAQQQVQAVQIPAESKVEAVQITAQPKATESVSEAVASDTEDSEVPQEKATQAVASASASEQDDDYEYPEFSDDDAPPMSDQDYAVFAGLESNKTDVPVDTIKSEPVVKQSVEPSNAPVSSAEAITETPAETSAPIQEPSVVEAGVESKTDTATVSAEPLSEEDLKGIWQKALDQLQMQGEMILYLFGKTAAVQLCGNDFNVIFAKEDKSQFEEFSKSTSQKALLQVLIALTGRSLNLKIRQEEDPEQAAAAGCATAEEPWIRKIRETADQFGIPVKMED